MVMFLLIRLIRLYGKLGHGTAANCTTPLVVDQTAADDDPSAYMQVACGTFHSIACTEDGKVKTWGFGGNGRLGHTDQTSCYTPSSPH